jgi:hypothetical protein
VMKIEVFEIEEAEDGGAIVTVHLDYESLLQFAKVGVVCCLIEAAEDVIEAAGKAVEEAEGGVGEEVPHTETTP